MAKALSSDDLFSVIDKLGDFSFRELSENAELVTIREDSITAFFNEGARILAEKHEAIKNNNFYIWLHEQPSYRTAFNSVFGGYPKQRWGADFACRMTGITTSYLNMFNEDDKPEVLHSFLRSCSFSRADDWHHSFIAFISIYLFYSDDFAWQTAGRLEAEIKKIREHLDLVEKLLVSGEENRSCFSSELKQQLESYKSKLEENISRTEAIYYDPVHRKEGQTVHQRYFLFFVWKWFTEKGLKSPGAETMANFLQVVADPPSERSIARTMARWKKESPFICNLNQRLDNAVTDDDYWRELRMQIDNMASLALMDVLHIKFH